MKSSFSFLAVALCATVSRGTSWPNGKSNLPKILQDLNVQTPAAGDGPGAKIVGGFPTTTEDYPWMVSLQAWSEDGLTIGHFCGGSLIRDDLVLTAAHCLDSMDEGMVTLEHEMGGGTWDIYAMMGESNVINQSTWDSTTTNLIVQSSYYCHPGYNGNTMANDICLMKLSDSFDFDTVSLMTSSLAVNGSYPYSTDDSMRVLGWGTRASNSTLTDTLEYTDTDVYDVDTCNDYFRLWYYAFSNGLDIDYWDPDFTIYEDDTSVSNMVFIIDGMLCTMGNYTDSCQGDSGGPLIFGTTNTAPQSGIVSFGIDCASGIPGVYADVAYFEDWIESATETIDLVTPSPTDDASRSAYILSCIVTLLIALVALY